MDLSFPFAEWIGRAQAKARASHRRATTKAAGLKDARDVEGLINASGDEDSYVRESAASALGALGDARALPALQRRQQHDTGEYPGRNVRDATTKGCANN